MRILCLDFEGVLSPEFWEKLGTETGVDDFKLKRRDINDYDELMATRLARLKELDIRLQTIESVAESLTPLPGAVELIEWLEHRFQLIILSNTFYEIAAPILRQLHWPTMICHQMEVDASGRILDLIIRQEDSKRCAIKALKSLNMETIAVGDSYSDVSMMAEADAAAFYRPPAKVAAKFSQYPVLEDFEMLKSWLLEIERGN